MYDLTEGAIIKIMNGVNVDKPIIQVLGQKKLSSTSNVERYRLLISDGKHINSFTMLATQLNHLITDGTMTDFSICRITQYTISKVNNNGQQKGVMVILGIEVLVSGSEVNQQIGNPTQFENTGTKIENAQSESKPSMKTPVSHNSVNTTANDSQIMTNPISSLSPYQNRWVIKVRVSNKSDIRTWNNSRGEGKLFSMDLVDESGEIRCTAFKNECDKFHSMIEIGKIYYISRCTLKPANKQFNNLKNDYEMTLTADSEVIPCHEEADIPMINFNFIPISSIEQRNKDEIIDILGIVKMSGELQELTARQTGRQLKKRDLTVVDESNAAISLTLWGTQAEQFDSSNAPTIAIKGARIGEFNGAKNISTLSSTVLQIDPDIEEAHKLRGWYNSGGKDQEVKQISRSAGGDMNAPWITIQDSKDSQFGYPGQPNTYLVKACISAVKGSNSIYKACPNEGCKKKVVDQDNGMYHCEKCQTEYPNFKYRLLANANLVDSTSNQWATAFNEESEKMLSCTAQELGELKDHDSNEFQRKMNECTYRNFLFKIRVKQETYMDETRLKAVIMGISPLDHKVYATHLLKKLKEFTGIGKA
ncbi:replication protein A 70 kDa DNA-binding subunit-like [Leptopilina heterotoma]|uniref:replication protein A 70 kDa DNA-binding subunit-like n=1 Tax=Leptopilina heterotoma TaxID=63436 RepID=UPI001CA9F7A7|nr:replication protein A 70 kDa DNA-binding subunit-like [Leptopilina heterotoma]